MPNIPEEIDIFEDVENNPKTGIGKYYTLENVRRVWAELSRWILKQLHNNKLGTFTLSQWSVETGIRREYKISRPIFLMSKSLVDDFDLHQPKQYVDDKVALTVINHLELSQITHCQPDRVKCCIDEVVQTVRRVASWRRDFHLQLTDLGMLRVRRTRVHFHFTSGEVASRQFVHVKPTCYRVAASLTPYKPTALHCPIHSFQQRRSES